MAPRPDSERGVASGREFILMVTMAMSMTAVSIDLMIPSFPDIRREFGMAADSSKVSWLIIGFFLGMAAGPLLYGPASDRFGRKRPLYVGLALYVLSAVAAAFAPSFGWLVAARFSWGLGAAGARTLSMAIIRDRYEGDAMARLMSLMMAVFLLVPILAPSLGAGLNAVAPWRIVFWVPAAAAVGLMVWARRLPETLEPERRRPFTWVSFAESARIVLTNRTTMIFALAMTLLMGVMNGYLASSELMLEATYGLGHIFPVFFGVNALGLALASLNNARIVGRLGITTVVRRTSIGAVGVAGALALVALLTNGKPDFWVFAIGITSLLPLAQGLIPNCNTAAMMPVAAVAGTASAILATVSTAGSALIGAVLSDGFDGTIRPYAFGAFGLIVSATALLWIATRSLASPAVPVSHLVE